MAERPEYTEIEHTADVGVALRAPDVRRAFERAAAASFDMMCPLDTVSSELAFDVRVEGRPGDLPHLMVRWLSELLYLYGSERVLLSEFEVLEFSEDEVVALVACVRGEPYDPGRHALALELKAPTYHQLRVEPDGDEWAVRVIFDT